MALHGAGHLVLMSRSGPRDDESQAGFEKIQELGATVTDARGDVTRLEDVQRIVDAVAVDGHPPLLGVIHGAMVLRDDFIATLTTNVPDGAATEDEWRLESASGDARIAAGTLYLFLVVFGRHWCTEAIQLQLRQCVPRSACPSPAVAKGWRH